MAQILEFKPRARPNSVEYEDLRQAIDTALNTKTLSYYQVALDACKDIMAPAEVKDITERLRAKRIELAQERRKPVVADKPGVYRYTPEMGDAEPVGCQLKASRSHYGKHWFIDSPEPIKQTVGVKFIRRYEAEDFSNGANNPQVGWYEYRVTDRAFHLLEQQYSISQELFLD